jgi:hypothetical protein
MQATVQEKGTVGNDTKTPLRITARAKEVFSDFTTPRTWRSLSLLALMCIWLALELNGIFSPGLLEHSRFRLHRECSRDACPARFRYAVSGRDSFFR